MICQGINVARNNKAADIDTSGPFWSPVTLASCQRIIPGSKELPCFHLCKAQLWPFSNKGKAGALLRHGMLLLCTLAALNCSYINFSEVINLLSLPLNQLKNLLASHHCIQVSTFPFNSKNVRIQRDIKQIPVVRNKWGKPLIYVWMVFTLCQQNCMTKCQLIFFLTDSYDNTNTHGSSRDRLE